MFSIRKNNALIAAACLSVSLHQTAWSQSGPEDAALTVYTGPWPPYVQTGSPPTGVITDIVRTVLDDMGETPDIRQFNFAYVYEKVARDEASIGFPFFQTSDREGQVLFSDPIFEVRSRLYYNRRFLDEAQAQDVASRTLGVVRGYRYGGAIDDLVRHAQESDRITVYDTEPEALAALIRGDVQLLPMAEHVAYALLEQRFSEEQALIAFRQDLDPPQSLHVIFPPEAQTLRDRFNASLSRLQQSQTLSSQDRATQTPARTNAVANIIAYDDIPIVLATGADGQTYPLAQGVSVVVLEWSDSMIGAAQDERLYAIMSDASRVLVLDGPQAGRELDVKNMHLAIRP